MNFCLSNPLHANESRFFEPRKTQLGFFPGQSVRVHDRKKKGTVYLQKTVEIEKMV